MRRRLALALGLALVSTAGQAQPATTGAPRDLFLKQSWTDEDRFWFYTTSQGSQIMPYRWFLALERPDSETLFKADRLARFGYLPNPYSSGPWKARNPDDLPVGFVMDEDARGQWIGMTCAACHTNQVKVAGKTRQIDGGPTNADMFAFIQELSQALEKTAASPDDPKFKRFAVRVLRLGENPPAEDVKEVYDRLKEFSVRFTDYVNQSRTEVPWGHARLDAFGMIFNRATAIDLDLPENNHKPNAPVSYPFLWDTSWHNKVQWNGSAGNRVAVERLARNVGEVLGVFARVSVDKTNRLFPPRFYDTSVHRLNLMLLEQRLRKLTSPAWPRDIAAIDAQKAAAGKELFGRHCLGCHQMAKTGPNRNMDIKMIPVEHVRTDPTMADNAINLRSKTGVLEGNRMPPLIGKPLGPEEKSFEVVGHLVIGAILEPPEGSQQVPQSLDEGQRNIMRAITANTAITRDALEDLGTGLRKQAETKVDLYRQVQGLLEGRREGLKREYKSRPLNGIWATAPYLHNGSVPNLYELLLPADQRSKSFMVGSAELDTKTVGQRTDVGPSTFDTSLPGNLNSGHDGPAYGTDKLTEEQRWELVEYMKTL